MWRLSITMDTAFCLEAVEEALVRYAKPDIFNTDQGSQFTSADFTGLLAKHKIAISMDGKGAWRDNVFAERLGVSQQTLAHYEVGRVGVGAAMLPVLADILDVSIDELLVGQPTIRAPGKRGPASRLQQQVDAIAQLPKAQQRAVSEVLSAMLAQHGGAARQEATATA